MKHLAGLLLICLGLISCTENRTEPEPVDPAAERAAVSAVLDNLHASASASDFDRYFGLYTDEAIFMGTDATERWTKAEFKDYARAAFEQGRGWTYIMTERNVFLAPDGRTAWFDERLENANLGDTRGTGVLVRHDRTWKIAQYNLTIPVPNDLSRDLVARIRAMDGAQ